MGLQVDVEVRTSRRRIDALIELAEKVLIFECKLDGTAEAELARIAERGYATPYKQCGKLVYAVGVAFGMAERGIVAWQIQQVQ